MAEQMNEHFTYPGTLVVIGGGRMGEAIVGGLVASGILSSEAITVVEPDASRRDAIAAAHGVRVSGEASVASSAGTVLLAVKPQVIDAVLSDLRDVIGGALVVSIAGGISCARIESSLTPGTAVVRVMPNTPALVCEGMAVISGGSEASAEQVEQVRQLFAALGRAVVLSESHQAAATAISGSGPAYFALFIDALARAGVEQGLTRDQAQELALQTMKGTAALIEETRQHPEVLIDAVSSPGGTTIAALGELERGGVRSALNEAVRAAVRRSRELGA